MSVRADNTNLDQCDAAGKLKFRSRAKAESHCSHIVRKNRRKGDRHPLHVYPCDACGGFHIGHDPEFSPRICKHLELKRA